MSILPKRQPGAHTNNLERRVLERSAAQRAPERLSVPAPEKLMWTDHRGGFRATRRGEQAVEAFEEADKIDQLPWEVPGDDEAYRREAEKFRACGRALLQPTAPVSVANGEAVSFQAAAGPDFPDAGGIIETLEKDPNSVAVGASGKRTQAVARLGLLEPALETAASAQASNSIERMLCHQMAVAHFTAMRLLEKSEGPHLQAGDVVRFTNAAARMLDVYQTACLVLLKLKTKGTQRVVVHINRST